MNMNMKRLLVVALSAATMGWLSLSTSMGAPADGVTNQGTSAVAGDTSQSGSASTDGTAVDNALKQGIQMGKQMGMEAGRTLAQSEFAATSGTGEEESSGGSCG